MPRRHSRPAAPTWRACSSSCVSGTALVAAGGGEQATERHRSRGKLTARERIDRLIDPGTAFLELDALRGLGRLRRPGAGRRDRDRHRRDRGPLLRRRRERRDREGRLCTSCSPVKKHLRAQEVAGQNCSRCVYLVDSGGASPAAPGRRVPGPRPLRAHLLQPGPALWAQHPADRRRDGLVHRRGAYVPAMSDETVIVEGTGTIFIGGPPLVRAATGEDVTAEELGGATLHTRRSGVADHYAVSDEHALALARQIVRHLGDPAPPPWEVDSRDAGVDRPTCTASCPSTTGTSSTPSRSSPASPTAAASTSSRRSTATRSCAARADRGHPVGISLTAASSSPSRRRRARTSSSSPASAASRSSSSRTSRASWSARTRGRRHRARRRQARHCSRLRRRPEVHRCHRWLVRRGQLRHVRPRLRTAAIVDVAQRPHLRDGRRAGGNRALDGGDADPDAIRASYEHEGSPYFSTARPGTTGSSTHSTHAASWPSDSPPRRTHPSGDDVRRLPDVDVAAPIRTRSAVSVPGQGGTMSYKALDADDIELTWGTFRMVRHELGGTAFGLTRSTSRRARSARSTTSSSPGRRRSTTASPAPAPSRSTATRSS